MILTAIQVLPNHKITTLYCNWKHKINKINAGYHTLASNPPKQVINELTQYYNLFVW